MRHLRVIAAFVIMGVWCVSYLTGVLQHDYTAFSLATPLMLVVATSLLVSGVSRRDGNGPSRRR